MKISFVNLKDVNTALQLEVRNWRNMPSVAQYFQIPYIDISTHVDWLKSLYKENPSNVAFLIKGDDEFIGLVYFLNINYLKKETSWGGYIYKNNLQGIGLGDNLMSWSIKYATKVLRVSKIKLEVLRKNERAKKLYEKFGFKEVANAKNNFVMRYELNLPNVFE